MQIIFPMREPKDASQRSVGLDLVRIFAALIVMFFHLAYWSWAPEGYSTPKSVLKGATSYPELVTFTEWGWVGVDIFFVLSGFVISYTALNSGALRFFWRRFLRLFPAALICASITLVVAFYIQWQPPSELLARYVRSVLFWPKGPYIDGQYWTLPIEVTFYAFVFCILASKQERWLEQGIIAFGCLSIGVRALCLVPDIAAVVKPALASQVATLTMTYNAHFALGAVVFFGYRNGWTAARTAMAAIFVIGALATRLRASPVAASVWLISVGTIFLSIHYRVWIDGRLRSVASTIAILSLSTYPLYLIHDLVGAAALRELVLSGADRFVALGLVSAACIALSVCIVTYPEAMIRAALKNRINSGSRQEPART